MIALILSAIMRTGRDLWKVVKLLAGMAVIAAQQVAGFIGGLVLLSAKNVIAQGLILVSVFALLRVVFSGLSSLIGIVWEWTPLSDALAVLFRNREGAIWFVWNGLAIDDLLASLLTIWETWLSCWAVFRAAQYSAVIQRFGILRGFWR